MRRRSSFLILLTLILASCGSEPVPAPTGIPIPTADAPAHAPEIRFALIGEPRDINVWELFDERGAGYADYALRAEYWPRLYYLAPPDLVFQPLAAEGAPSSVIQEGGFYSATVNLRPDFKWTDGSAFTAGDVAFTVNTALAFELGFDWNAYYSRDFLSRAEAVDPSTVKFFFKQKPNVGIWQYGALQGPVVQRSFWEPVIEEALILLPDDALRGQVDEARAYLAKIQIAVDDLAAQVNALRLSGRSDRKLEASLTGSQNELIFAQNTLNKVLEDYEEKMTSAREALYALDDAGEPTLGAWIPAGRQGGVWVNQANPDFPFLRPNFDRAVYLTYEDEGSVLAAFDNNEVDVILSPNAIFYGDRAKASPGGSGRFLVFNPRQAVLSDPALRRSLSCLISPRDLAGGQEEPSDGFIPAGPWKDDDLSFPCAGFSRELMIEKAVEILRDAGYTWSHEPTAAEPGSGLALPDGTLFPSISLITASPEDEPSRVHAAEYVQLQMKYLGIPIVVELTDPGNLRFDVFSSGEYDLAILGWRLSAYPGYLCDWFGASGQFGYGNDRLNAECDALAAEADLESARQYVFTIQSILVEDLPFLPLFTRYTYDAFQNVRYPFENVTGGLNGLYGAPSYAMPSK